jgi:hypothetical protein
MKNELYFVCPKRLYTGISLYKIAFAEGPLELLRNPYDIQNLKRLSASIDRISDMRLN